MNFASLLSAMGLAAVKAEARATAQRLGRQAAVAAVVGLLVLTAIGLGLAALTVWLAGEVGTIWALLIVAGGLLVIAAIVLLAVRLSARKPATYRRSFVPPPSFTAAPSAPPPEGGDAPPAGSFAGSVALVAIIGFILARQLIRK